MNTEDIETLQEVPFTLPETSPGAGACARLEEEDDGAGGKPEEAEDDEPVWSMLPYLTAHQAPAENAPLLEVLRLRGEVLVDHRVLHPGERTKLVRFVARGHAEIDGRPIEGPTVINVGDDQILVRFATAPSMVWSAADLAEAKRARTINAITTSLGAGLMSIFGLIAWAAQFRDREIRIVPIEDQVDVYLPRPPTFTEPPEPQQPMETKRPAPRAVVGPTKPSVPAKARRLAVANASPANVMDAMKNIPIVGDDSRLKNAIEGIHPVAAKNAELKISQTIGRGPRNGVGGGDRLKTWAVGDKLDDAGRLTRDGTGEGGPRGTVSGRPKEIKKEGGELSMDEIQKVVNKHIGEIQFCYEKALRNQSGLRGRVKIEWVIAPDGRVLRTGIASSELGSAAAESCMLKKVGAWRFPSPKGGAMTVRYPFIFEHI